MFSTPYNLITRQENSDQFYLDLELFTGMIIQKAEAALGVFVCDFSRYSGVPGEDGSENREKLLELLLLGVLWMNYGGKATATNRFSTWLPAHLYSLRRKSAFLKPGIDRLRGPLAYSLLEKNKSAKNTPVSLKSMESLINWLTATGEFREETERLKHWKSYLSLQHEDYQVRLITSCIHFALYFTARAKNALGGYTRGLSIFQERHLDEYANKEDFFLAARKENEYHLNMVGAALLNQSLNEAFTKTSRKSLLLPTCMRTEPKGGCQAKSDGKAQVCRSCNPMCNIGKVATPVRTREITTYIIPHSSDFTRFLKLWKGQEDTGLIGVACILHLLTGGYEMQRLNLPSQCVFLDFCGCQKHWEACNRKTNLNINQLNNIIGENKQNMLQAS